MNYLEKIKTVRENILLWSTKNGSDFHYPITGFYTENEITNETTTIVTKGEQEEIIRYLARRKFLDIIKETSGGGSFHLKILPKTTPTIRLKTLEIISRDLKDYYTGTEIVALLKECGVDDRFIVYPETKWVIFYNVFEELAIGKDDKAKKLLLKIIGDAIHPINLGGNEETAKQLAEKFNNYLKYDDFLIEKDSKKYEVISKKDYYDRERYIEEMMGEAQEPPDDGDEDDIERQIDVATLSKAKEKIKEIRDCHQSYIDVVELFCRNPKKPTKELNDAYLYLAKKIQKDIKELKLQHYIVALYRPFKEDLYKAEVEWNGDEVKGQIVLGPKLSWDVIRPSLYAVHSEITNLCNIADEETEMTGDEKKLEEINNLIAKERVQLTPATKESVKQVEILHKYEKKEKLSKRFSDCVIRFDDQIPAIFIDNQEVPLPEYGKEHYLARSLFNRKKNEAVDWSIVYNDMQSKKGIPDKEEWRYVYDAYNDINKRVQDILSTEEKLFNWSEKTIKRLH